MKKSGMILLITLVLCAFMFTLSVVLFELMIAKRLNSHTTNTKSDALALADGGVEQGISDLLTDLANDRSAPTSGSATIDGKTISYTAATVGTQRTETDSDGINTQVQAYTISSTATVANHANASYGNVSSTSNSIVDVRFTPLFQYAVFYTRDLEILPGPSMTIAGRIHTNKDLYIATNSGSTFTVDSDYLRAVGKIHRHRKDTADVPPGALNIKKKSSTPVTYNPMETWFDSSYAGNDVNGDGDYNDAGDTKPFEDRSKDLWNGTVLTGVNGIYKSFFPEHSQIEPYVAQAGGNYNYDPGTQQYVQVDAGTGNFNKGNYHGMADLVITSDGTNYHAYDNAGNDITASLPANTLTNATFYDAREGKTVKTVDIDIAKLNTSGKFPANGIIYASRTDTTASNPNGFRMKNGSELLRGLTVVTPSPTYVWGDYNTVNKKGAAIISDAFNLLSNAWNNSKTSGNLPTATATTFNCAFIGGNYGTTSGNYNGGFENLPRFHENWSGINANLKGSFINLWDSLYAKGTWIYGGDKYTAPVRNWSFDTDYNNVNNLPPGTPKSVTVVRKAWWEGDPASGGASTPTPPVFTPFTVSQTDSNGFNTQLTVTQNADGTYTYTYNVTSDADTNTPALSHIVFGMPSSSDKAGPGSWSYGTDPTSGVTGWKSDETGTGLGEDGVAGSQTYTFTTSVPPADVTVATKAGTDVGTVNFNNLAVPNPTPTPTPSPTSVPAPVITSSASSSGQINVFFSFQITATNSPSSYFASGMPVGLTINTDSGLISGTPTDSGTFSVTITATNAGGNANQTHTMTINSPTPVITSAATSNGVRYQAFSFQVAATNSPTSYSASGLPNGLSINASSGLISGTPAVRGTFTVIITGTNAGGSGTQTHTMTITRN